MSIWDSGTVEIDKWEEDKVVFILHGQPEGGLGGKPRRYALIQTGDGDDDWLIRLMKDQPKAASSTKSRSKKKSAATKTKP